MLISKVRGVSVPDTEEQAEWLISHRQELSRCRLNPDD